MDEYFIIVPQNIIDLQFEGEFIYGLINYFSTM